MWLIVRAVVENIEKDEKGLNKDTGQENDSLFVEDESINGKPKSAQGQELKQGQHIWDDHIVVVVAGVVVGGVGVGVVVVVH